MPTFAVKETLAVYAHAIDTVEASKRAALQTVRSWSRIAESASPFPQGWDGPWNLADAALDSAESFVTAQTEYAKSILEATAAALGVVPTKGTPRIAARTEFESVPVRTLGTPKPVVVVETAATPAPSRPKPPVKKGATKPRAPKATGGTKGA